MAERVKHVDQTLTVAGRYDMVELPAYVRGIPSRVTGRERFYFEVPGWARTQGCPVQSCNFGYDRDAAVVEGQRKGSELHEWLGARHALRIGSGPLPGSLGELVGFYKGHRNYRDISAGTRRVYDLDLRALTSHEMRSDRWPCVPLGRMPWQAITPQLVDSLIDDLLMRIVQINGQVKVIRTPRRARSIISTAATMWNVAMVASGLPIVAKPFAGHRIKRDTRETTAASADQLCDVVGQADALGHDVLGTIILAVYEFVWRPEHVVRDFMVEHYRPADRPDEILIADAKNGVRRWRPLYDHTGEPQYPALMARLNALKGDRLTGFMFAHKDATDGSPPSIVTVRKWLADTVAQTPHEGLTLATFRHGGLTECGEAGLNELEIQRLSHHKTTSVLTRYVHATSVGQELSQAKRVTLRKGRRSSTRGTRFLAGASHAQGASAQRRTDDE